MFVNASILGLHWIWLFQIQPEQGRPDLGTQICPEPDLAETCLSQNNTPVIKLMALTMLSAAIEAIQFRLGASFVVFLFASLWKNW